MKKNGVIGFLVVATTVMSLLYTQSVLKDGKGRDAKEGVPDDSKAALEELSKRVQNLERVVAAKDREIARLKELEVSTLDDVAQQSPGTVVNQIFLRSKNILHDLSDFCTDCLLLKNVVDL